MSSDKHSNTAFTTKHVASAFIAATTVADVLAFTHRMVSPPQTLLTTTIVMVDTDISNRTATAAAAVQNISSAILLLQLLLSLHQLLAIAVSIATAFSPSACGAIASTCTTATMAAMSKARKRMMKDEVRDRSIIAVL